MKANYGNILVKSKTSSKTGGKLYSFLIAQPLGKKKSWFFFIIWDHLGPN